MIRLALVLDRTAMVLAGEVDPTDREAVTLGDLHDIGIVTLSGVQVWFGVAIAALGYFTAESGTVIMGGTLIMLAPWALLGGLWGPREVR